MELAERENFLARRCATDVPVHSSAAHATSECVLRDEEHGSNGQLPSCVLHVLTNFGGERVPSPARHLLSFEHFLNFGYTFRYYRISEIRVVGR